MRIIDLINKFYLKLIGHKDFDPDCIEHTIDGKNKVTFRIPIGEIDRDKSIKIKDLMDRYKEYFDVDKIIYESIQKNRKEKLDKLGIK